jgi:phosphohistidine phosphatase
MRMRLYLLRHGPAGDSAQWRGPDEDRPLTERGRASVGASTARLKALGVTVDLVLTSPYARAAQTAEIFSHGLGMDEPPTEEPLLRAGFGPDELRDILRARAGVERLVLVGHEPDLSTAVGYLVGGARVRMKKGALARVDLDDPERLSGTLVWLVQPDVLRG